MLQGGEIIIIALLALIVLGPRRLPEMARKIGQWSAELRQAAREITKGLEAEVEDLKQVGEELKAPVDDLKKPLKELEDEIKESDPRRYEWSGPKPVSGPTPEDAMADLEAMEEAAKSAPAEGEATTADDETDEAAV